MTIDLNCDVGEGGGFDEDLMPLVTSANIACGGHAGNSAMMRDTAALARRLGVKAGAHPGFADRENFGRRECRLSEAELTDLVQSQVSALRSFTTVTHVKPHGALYNLAARERATADVIAAAVRQVDPSLALYGLAGSELIQAGRRHGLRVVEEVFADRTYQADGSLTPRSDAHALINDVVTSVSQVLQMIRKGTVRAVDGSEVTIRAETICLHGDGPHCVTFARAIRRELEAAGIVMAAP
jgi:UPF0271 protein